MENYFSLQSSAFLFPQGHHVISDVNPIVNEKNQEVLCTNKKLHYKNISSVDITPGWGELR